MKLFQLPARLLKRLLSIQTTFPSTKSQSQPSSLENSPFKQLPTELISSIAEFLPLSAAASFTLTCRPIWFILGSQYLDRIRLTDGFDRPVFLDLLQRDLPRHILCLDCEMLHSRVQLGNQMPCTKADYASFADWFINDKFSSVELLLVMKLYHSGLNYDERLSSLSGFRSHYMRSHILHQEFAPRIANGHFLMRHQTWILLPAGRKLELPKLICTCVCPHWRFNMPYATELTRKMRCRASHWDNAQLNSRCQTCSGLFQCWICPTEFQIDAMDFSEYGVALLLTRWLDLGEGWSLLDSRYRSHVRYYYGNQVPFKAGSIKATYEGVGVDMIRLLTPKYKAEMLKHKLL